MPDFINSSLIEPVTQAMNEQLIAWAMVSFYEFTLVMIRVSGLMLIGPLFGSPLIPMNIRALLVIMMAMLITPALSSHAETAFYRLDENQNGRVSRDEVPPHFEERFDTMLSQAGKSHHETLTVNEFRYRLALPQSLLDYTRIGIMELALGLILGLGVFIVLSGVQMAGRLIDQQSAIDIGEIFNPGTGTSNSVTGQFFFYFATTVLLVMKPLNGHLLMTSALIETFQTIPVGDAFVSVHAVELMRDLIHQSFVLGVQIAAPALAVMSMVVLTMGFLNRSVPQINVITVGFPVRVTTNLFIVSVSVAGFGRILVDRIPIAIDQIRVAMTSS